MGFWSSFWPNLASTIVGVGGGVPLGLWLNRRALTHSNAARRRAERAEVAHTLEVLSAAIDDNRARLETFATVLKRNETLFDLGLDTSAWGALQAGLTSELKDPTLRRQLARYFVRLGGIVALNERYLRFLVGVDASMSSAPEVKKKLAAAIPTAVDELIRTSTELVSLIRDARSAFAA